MLTSHTKEAEKFSFDEYAAIAAALQPYIDAARTGNGSGMRHVWFDHAHIVGSLDGNPINVDAEAFCKFIDEVGGSPDVQARIVSIDYQGNAGSAHIEFQDWGGARYTDFFVLYKQDGQWKISAKVYDSHTRN
ncbi:MAG: nuclear transport factor 2 family protein [Coleofasciculaceae cyanobacterium SM2_3_26]|nr:nuclear transport factor 2 family protein [Coleofasciculaceae cyanobacterium SM2_3_26]